MTVVVTGAFFCSRTVTRRDDALMLHIPHLLCRMAIARCRLRRYRSAMAEENPSLRDLKLNPVVVVELESHGYHRLDDLRPLSNVQILRIPNVGGKSFKRILAALGR